MKLSHPKKLKSDIVAHNQDCRTAESSETCRNQRSAIGAAVTSATLCRWNYCIRKGDILYAVRKTRCGSRAVRAFVCRTEGKEMLAYARLGGLGSLGREALEVGLAQWCVPHEELARSPENCE